MSKKELAYHIKKYATFNNAVLSIAAIIVISGVWSTISTLQKNYTLQRQVNELDQQIEIAELEVATQDLEQDYFKSNEYLELSARKYLGKVLPGEKVIILPKSDNEEPSFARPARSVQPSNYELWRQFFFGTNG